MTMTPMRPTSTHEQEMMTAHVQCSRSSNHHAQPLSTTCPLLTPPQPHITNQTAQHMCHDRCFCTFCLLHKHACKLNRFKETARCCLPNNSRLWRRAHKTGRIAHPWPTQCEKKTLKHMRHCTDACVKKSKCEKSSDEVGAAARVGRASGSAAAGVRLRLASLVTPATKARSHPTRAR